MRYPVVIEKGRTNFSAYAPDVPGCVTSGRTMSRTIANMGEAMEFHLQSMVDDGEPLPVPCGVPIVGLVRGDEIHFVDVRLHEPARK